MTRIFILSLLASVATADSFIDRNMGLCLKKKNKGKSCSLMTPGYCIDSMDEIYSYCAYDDSESSPCQAKAEASSMALGWEQDNKGACFVLYDAAAVADLDQKDDRIAFCGEDAIYAKFSNDGTGAIVGTDGKEGAECYVFTNLNRVRPIWESMVTLCHSVAVHCEMEQDGTNDSKMDIGPSRASELSICSLEGCSCCSIALELVLYKNEIAEALPTKSGKIARLKKYPNVRWTITGADVRVFYRQNR